MNSKLKRFPKSINQKQSREMKIKGKENNRKVIRLLLASPNRFDLTWFGAAMSITTCFNFINIKCTVKFSIHNAFNSPWKTFYLRCVANRQRRIVEVLKANNTCIGYEYRIKLSEDLMCQLRLFALLLPCFIAAWCSPPLMTCTRILDASN
ncbi:CLUMA_CG012908, isoform A [Clunio marinus]|uniref:CLUMA_CG012908, isoform A n=1 Tax=Clunio marinus TaxID=568069 RepID=A0A1J1IJ75_9DIPT|nr:CLUMA_CG012908, isoform A [Clunio marinus]